MRRLACVKQQVQDGQEIHQPPPQTAELCDHRGVVSRQAGAVKLTFRLAQRLPRMPYVPHEATIHISPV
jgi:hypothetical protein